MGTDNQHQPGARGGNNFLSLTLDAMPAHAHAVIPSGIHNHVGTAENAGEHNHLYSSRTSEDGDHSHSCVNAWVEDHRPFLSGNSEGVPGDQDLDTAGAGSHTHTIPPTNPAGDHTHRIQAGDTLTGSAHTHTLEPTGAGAPIDKRPFFYRLAYIIKL